jgi:2-keto-3-deoxy-L-fuconate dehydrogenase
MGRLEGRRTFLTAAGQGIGRATAEAFVREGAEVVATDVNRKTLEGLKGAARLEALDARDTAAIEKLAASIGEIDVLFNCAGYVHHGTVLECSEQEWDFSFDLNVKSMHRTIRAFLPGMLKRAAARGKPGSIVNVASTVSSLRGAPNRYVYGATKAAVIGLTKAVAADFIRQGIRCNAIAPGTVMSPSLQGRVQALAKTSGDSEEKVWEMFVGRQPMGRLGTAEEMAAVAVYLASDESAFTTGTVIAADGGFTL